MNYIELQIDLPKVSAIVLIYNSKQHLKLCLESLEELNYPKSKFEIVLVDNNSSDDSIAFVRAYYPEVKIINFNENSGYAKGNNKAAHLIDSEYIAFLNPDTKVDKDWLINLVCVAISRSDEQIVAFGGKVKFLEDPTVVQVAGSKMCIHGNGYNIGYGRKDCDEFNKEGYTLSPSGCSMLVDRKAFLHLGGFDQDYFMYVEEFDFGYRLWLAGYKSFYVPSAIVYHKMEKGLKFKIKPFIIYNEEKNRLTTIVKNFQCYNVLKGMVISILYGIYRIIAYSKNRQFDLSIAILKGQMDFLLNLKMILKKRKNIQRNRVLSDREMVQLGLLSGIEESYNEFKRIKKYR